MRVPTIILFFLLLLPVGSGAATIRVEKDGSGDFTVIQDAVDAAEDGDTIEIGPGRFSDVHDFLYYGGFTTQVCVTLEKSLNIIGSGQGVTVITPANGFKTQSEPGGFASRSANLDVLLSDLTVENCPGNAILFDMEFGGKLEMERVEVSNSFSGVVLKRTQNSRIHDCSFQTTGQSGVWAWNVVGLLVDDCFFQGHRGILYYEALDSEIKNCRTENLTLGFSLSFCEGVTVSHCQLSDSSYRSLSLWGGNDILVHDVEAIDHSQAGLGLKHHSSMGEIEIRDSVFKGGEVTCYIDAPIPGLAFHNNHILPSDEGWTVWATHDLYSGPDTWVSLTNNYWGTDVPGEVAASIHDGHDDEECHMFIFFEPMAGGPVGTNRTTLGGLKALFR